MNAKNSKSHTADRPGDESDDPGPSQVAAATGQDEPEIRIGGEAAHEIDRGWLRDHLAQAAKHLPVPLRSVNVEVVHDERMKALHARHTGIAETTDVLTFPASENSDRGPIDADIVLCYDEARWRAGQYEYCIERELLLYALHGLLHCAGFDDHDEAGFEAMHAEEDRILEAIGVGRTFRAADAGEAGHDAAHMASSLTNSVERDRGNED